ncbi:sensor histidine kinase [Flavobacterium salilacus subsp. salilacus]|uniref:sensor histidine kinase n=1 Tax=Flavobacterium TaxID=237 RepID=UPI001074D21B|nr:MULTISPECIES: sensor histidine kinase [Flavobacterium]KAF2517462.1 sensor histidine kinase [Flavobacterium salilacus subsp. salilacus]MBE1615606.1 sensor histidine kinase [Flavobacterium sp. SaA2.13]
MENNVLPQNNETGIIIIYVIFLMLFMGVVLLLFFYFSKKKIIQKELEKKDLELEYQKELLHATLLVQEEERQRIARDLHDDISSKLNVVSLNSHLLTTPDLSEKEVAEITDNIVKLVAKALESSRKIAHDLLPPVLEKFGLNAGIEELCFEYNSSKITIVNYENNVSFTEIIPEKQLHIFRIIQELINNSVRHGSASEITILFKEKDNVITCIYTDNGKGFDTKEIKSKKGLGMKNIESRIFFLKGEITIDSVINKGTQITFNFSSL